MDRLLEREGGRGFGEGGGGGDQDEGFRLTTNFFLMSMVTMMLMMVE